MVTKKRAVPKQALSGLHKAGLELRGLNSSVCSDRQLLDDSVEGQLQAKAPKPSEDWEARFHLPSRPTSQNDLWKE